MRYCSPDALKKISNEDEFTIDRNQATTVQSGDLETTENNLGAPVDKLNTWKWCILSIKKANYVLDLKQGHREQVEGSDYFPLFGDCETAAEILCSALGSLVQEIHRYTGVSPEKGLWDARNYIPGEAERAGFV